ncbi:MAG: YHS domain-containing (seleno)protein [Pseudomonadota bacterium]
MIVTTAMLFVATPAFATPRFASARFSDLAVRGYDTTAYFEHGEARQGVRANEVEWKGATWRFASAAEADIFRANPDAYAPQFGGYCTRAMSLERITLGDPEVWRIRGDKLYLFARPVGGQKFDDDPDTMIALAQAHWDTLDLTE